MVIYHYSEFFVTSDHSSAIASLLVNEAMYDGHEMQKQATSELVLKIKMLRAKEDILVSACPVVVLCMASYKSVVFLHIFR